MKRLWLLLLILALFATGAAAALAQGDAEEPPVDNLCDEGELWGDGRCQIPQIPGATELAWRCGWYAARILDGRLPASALPTACQPAMTDLLTTLPPVLEICKLDSEEGAQVTICVRSDQTGSIFDDDEELEFPFEIILRFIPEFPQGPEDCPSVPGYEPIFPLTASELINDFGFTSEELASLGLLPFACAYLPEGTPTPV